MDRFIHISNKSKFAVAALVDIALREYAGPVNLNDISRRQGVSLTFAEKIFSKLRKQELVKSVRGPSGGYCLAHAAEQVCIADILRAVDRPRSVAPVEPEGLASDPCFLLATHQVIASIETRALNFLHQIPLSQLVAAQRASMPGGVLDEGPPTEAPSGVFRNPLRQRLDVKAPNSVFALGSAAWS